MAVGLAWKNHQYMLQPEEVEFHWICPGISYYGQPSEMIGVQEEGKVGLRLRAMLTQEQSSTSCCQLSSPLHGAFGVETTLLKGRATPIQAEPPSSATSLVLILLSRGDPEESEGPSSCSSEFFKSPRVGCVLVLSKRLCSNFEHLTTCMVDALLTLQALDLITSTAHLSILIAC